MMKNSMMRCILLDHADKMMQKKKKLLDGDMISHPNMVRIPESLT